MSWVANDPLRVRAAMRHYRTPTPLDFNEAVALDEREHADRLTQEQLDRAAERADCAVYDLHPGLLGHRRT